MTPEEKLRALGLELPPAPKPVGAYVPAVRSGNLVFVSGQLPMRDGELLVKGRVGGPSTTLPVESLWVERGAALSLSPLDPARGDPECVEGSKGGVGLRVSAMNGDSGRRLPRS
ncbi:MAG TPA: RidA family protein, partial [Phycisphaerae bacterium]|nr:RidA family protein [Phycisphaerae bacterium]